MGMAGPNFAFFERVVGRLTELGVEFVREGNLDGHRFDLVVREPGGSVLGVDLKRWSPMMLNVLRLQDEVRSLRRAIPNSFMVVDMYAPGRMPDGVLSEEEFYAYLLTQKAKPRGGIRGEAPLEEIARLNSPLIFAAMPFAPQYSDTYYLGIVAAANGLNATSKRVDEEPFSGDIVLKIKEYIRNSVGVVADLSEAKPNVMYELGFADALGIPVVQITSTSLGDLPFDVGHNPTIEYGLGQVGVLIPKLEEHFRKVFKLPRH